MLSTPPARQRSLQRCRRTHCIGRCPPCHSGSTPQPPAWGQGTGQVSQPAATPHSNATERCGQAASTHKGHAPHYAAAREQQTQHQQRGVGPARKRMQTGTLRLAASAARGRCKQQRSAQSSEQKWCADAEVLGAASYRRGGPHTTVRRHALAVDALELGEHRRAQRRFREL